MVTLQRADSVVSWFLQYPTRRNKFRYMNWQAFIQPTRIVYTSHYIYSAHMELNGYLKHFSYHICQILRLFRILGDPGEQTCTVSDLDLSPDLSPFLLDLDLGRFVTKSTFNFHSAHLWRFVQTVWHFAKPYRTHKETSLVHHHHHHQIA